jgi:hypothetical protein
LLPVVELRKKLGSPLLAFFLFNHTDQSLILNKTRSQPMTTLNSSAKSKESLTENQKFCQQKKMGA